MRRVTDGPSPQHPPLQKDSGAASERCCCDHTRNRDLDARPPTHTHTPLYQPGVHAGCISAACPTAVANPGPHLEQHSGHWGGPCRAKAVVRGAGVFSQSILIPQGNDQRAFCALGPAGELEGRGDDNEKKVSRGKTEMARGHAREEEAHSSAEDTTAQPPGLTSPQPRPLSPSPRGGPLPGA